jgi:hypothetical protein
MSIVVNDLNVIKRLGPSRGENAKDWTGIEGLLQISHPVATRQLNWLSFTLSSFSCWSLPYNVLSY